MENNIYSFIVNQTTNGKIDKEAAIEMIAMLKQGKAVFYDDIAIIGMSARLPGAADIHEYWNNIVAGVDSVKQIPPNRRADTEQYIKFSGLGAEKEKYPEYGYLERIDGFDYDFFRISPKESSLTDPHQRIFLEEAMKTIEDAGYGGGRLEGTKTGVYLGYAQSPKDLYGKIVYDIDPTMLPISTVGNMQAMAASRISYLLNLKGPALVIDTACSSALIAIEMACQAIKQGQCDMAIAGGIKLNIIPLDDENVRIGIESSDWRTRAFDDTADGSGVGEGAGAVLLKPLKKAIKDGDHIYAVIKGSAVNHDGTTAGITVPSPSSQTAVIQKAWDESGIDPETVDYIETHGTGTKLGDPIEITGIEGAFRNYTNKKQFCAISSVKSNIGHLSEAAGIASIIKMALSLKYKKIPATQYFNKPHSSIEFTNSPLYVNTTLRDWNTDGHPRRGGISAFGMSGTNCHLVLEEAPEIKVAAEAKVYENVAEIFVASARSKQALHTLLENYDTYLQHPTENRSISDLCFTANTGRGAYSHRLALLVYSLEDLHSKLQLCLDIELESLKGPWAFYDSHKLTRGYSERKPGEIDEQEKKQMTTRAQALMESSPNKGTTDEEILSELCSLYVSGADISWVDIYKGQARRKISLPGYPFQESRCWVEYPESDNIVETADENGLFYHPVWVHKDLAFDVVRSLEGSVLLIGEDYDDYGISSLLNEDCVNNENHLITVSIGEEFIKHSENMYTIRNVQEDYDRLLEEIDTSRLVRVIHMLASHQMDEIDSLEMLEQSQNRNVISCLYLYKALMQKQTQAAIDIVLLTDYAHEVNGLEPQIKPQNAMLYGLGKVIVKEQPHLYFRSLDIDRDTPPELVVQEIIQGSGISPFGVAYRSGNRYIEQFEQVDIDSVPDERVTIKPQGVYIITGGTGGIGLEIAKSLARLSKPIVLALINRSFLPEKENWDRILSAGSDLKTIHKINVIREIEQLGAVVKVYQADISSEDALSEVLSDLRREYQTINGVIHAAGIAIDQLLVDKQEPVMREVLRPKVQGTWLLDKLTEQDTLEFFVMFSSVATIYTAITQGDYVAANAYMDAFASYRNKLGKKTLTINWTTWKETGMAAATGAAINTIFKTLPTSRGVDGFTQVLNKQISRVLIGQINLDGLGLTLLDKSTVRLSDSLQQVIDDHKQERKESERYSKRGRDAKNRQVQLTGKDNFSEAEKNIADVCKAILGYSELDINDNFFELGADSILLTRIHSELDQIYPGTMTIADMFEHSSISKLAEYIVQKDMYHVSQDAGSRLEEHMNDSEIAIIGLSLQLPMVETAGDFWNALQTGHDHGSSIPDSRRKDIEKFIKFKGYPLNAIDYEHGTYLDDIDKFDYRFFRMSPKEASTTDPNHRLFLQTAWHAIEDAGYGGDKIFGTNTGVYLGFASNMVYFHRLICEVEPESEGSSMVGNTASVATGRVSYLFDLRGPSVVVDTACSSSLTAVHLACKSIRMGDCEMAIAGGVKLNLLPIFRKGSPRGIGMESGDGKTRAFDHFSDGTGSGEGVAAVVLKPLKQAIKDRDHIYAVIKGSASNQDGSSAGLTAPNPAAQEEVIIKAWEDAGIQPETISYMETHGTGTKLGDPIEIQGIQNAFRRYTDKKQFCAIGSVKTNITHLAEAAGIAGIIKAALALKNKELPPSIFFNRPNRTINFSNSPVYVNVTRRNWDTIGHPRRCGVSGFGLSGTNCHVVMEEFTPVPQQPLVNEYRNTPLILTLSAMSEPALRTLVNQYKAERFEEGLCSDFRNVCYTSSTGRGHYSYRLSLIVNDIEDLKEKLKVIGESDFYPLQGPGVFFGYHKIVSESKTRRVDGEITEKQRVELAKQSLLIIEKCKSEESAYLRYLEQLCELYVQGANIDWEVFYSGEERYRVSLPTYPYEKERCWIEVPDYEENVPEMLSGGLYHAGEWVKREVPPVEEYCEDGPILLLMDEKGLGQSLADIWENKGKQVVKVFLKDHYVKLASDSYEVNGTEENYIQLLKDNKRRKWSKIVHLLSIVQEGMADDWDGFRETQRRGVYSLFYFTKAVTQVGLSSIVDMVVVSEYVDEVTNRETSINPWNAPLIALGKTVRQELPNLMCRCIDIDNGTNPETIIREIAARPSQYQVAYREGERYIELFKEYQVKEVSEQNIDVKETGVYLITGGTGGMGIETAKYLAARKKVKIALLSRTSLPDRKMWDEIVYKNSRTEQKIIKRIKAVREVEEMGAEVECYSVDVADLKQMEALVKELRRRYGRINGVVHAAGVGGEGFLYVKDEKVFNEVLHPKIYGTWIIDKLTAEDQPDFFIMYSSMSSRFAVQGQGDYCAANAFQDAYSKFRNHLQRKTLCINWVAWKDTGMAVEFGVNSDGAFKAISTVKAMRSFDEVLNKKISNVMIGEINYNSDVLWELGLVPQLMEPHIEEAVNLSRRRWEARQQVSQRRIEGEIRLTGKDGEYSDLEAKLAEFYCEVLGFNEIDIYDNFFELGGDSIMLSKIHASIEGLYPGKVRLLDLFEYTSVHQLYEFLMQSIQEQEDESFELFDQKTGQTSELEDDDSDHLEEDTKRVMDELDKGNLSIEQAIEQLMKPNR